MRHKIVEASSFTGLTCLVPGSKGLEYRFIFEEVLEDPQFVQLERDDLHASLDDIEGIDRHESQY